MAHDIARILKHAVLAFIAICCGLMLVWGFSGTARAQTCVTIEAAFAQWRALNLVLGVPVDIEARTVSHSRRLLIARLPGQGPEIQIFENGCFVRSYAGPVLPLVPRAEA